MTAEERIGFLGIVIEDLSQAPKVNQVISQYQEIVTGRIGVPDHERAWPSSACCSGAAICKSALLPASWATFPAYRSKAQ